MSVSRVLVFAALCVLLDAAPGKHSSQAKFVWFIVREDCWDTFFTKFDLFNVSCLKASISKALGFAIIAGSFVVKLPQVINILKSQSVAGLSATATYLELLSSILAAVWHVWNGSPFSAYGESIIVAMGTVVIVLLLWYFARPSLFHMLAWTVLMAATAALATQRPQDVAWQAASTIVSLGYGDAAVVPKRLTGKLLMDMLQYGGSSLFAFSRLSQIAAIASTGSTGQLSIITLAMNFAGTAARVFTSSQEVGDKVQLAASFVNAFLNGALVAQYLFLNCLKRGTVAPKADANKATKLE